MSGTDAPKPSSLRLLILAPTTHATLQDANNQGQNASSDDPDDTKHMFTTFLKGLTGVEPSQDVTTFAGYTSHPPLCLRTKYYASDVSMWCDTLPEWVGEANAAGTIGLNDWKEQMLSNEAREAREVIGGLVVLLPHNAQIQSTSTQKTCVELYIRYIDVVNSLREAIEDDTGRDISTLVVVQDMTPNEVITRRPEQEGDMIIMSFVQLLEDTCVSENGIFGWDIVPWQSNSIPTAKTLDASADKHVEDRKHMQESTSVELLRNEYGEELGMARILEVLEQVDWSTPVADNGDHEEDYGLLSTDDFSDIDDDAGRPGPRPNIKAQVQGLKDPLTEQSNEFQREIMGLHFALAELNQEEAETDTDAGNDLQVEQLTGLMDRVAAIREAGADMSREERQKFARREVGKIIRQMDFSTT